MKKFLLSCVAIVAAVFAANAQLYVVGAGEGLDWTPENPMVVDAANGKYTFTVYSSTMIKVSPAMGDWDTFNAAAVSTENEITGNSGTYNLVPSDANIAFPWKGDWTLVIDTDLTSATITTTTPAPEGFADVYVRGACNGWGVDEAWKFSTTDGKVYTFDADLEKVALLSEPRWKIADADWGNVNFESADPLFVNDFPAALLFNAGDQNMYIDWEGEEMTPVTIVFNYNGKDGSTVEVKSNGSGIEGVSVDNAPAVYYNLQGVQVANPANGLYIVKQGNKVSKMLVK